MVLCLMAVAGYGEQTIYLRNTVSAQGMQDLGNAVRAVAQVPSAAVDAEKRVLVVSGTAEQVALAEWLSGELDRTSSAPAFGKKVYSGKVEDGKVVAVFSLAHLQTARDLQEAVNVVRSVADIQRFIPYNAAMAIGAAGTADQIAVAEWLLGELDAPGQPRTGAVMHDHAVDVPVRAGTQAQVLFLGYPHTPLELQQMVNTARSLADIQRLFPMNARNALVMRGSPEQVEFSDWLLTELDKPAGRAAASTWIEKAAPGDSRSGSLAGIFYLAHLQVDQALVNALREATKLLRVYPNEGHNALALRGSGDQIALARQMLEERDR